MPGQQVGRPLLFSQKNLTKLTVNLLHKIYGFGVVISYQKETSKTQKLTKILRGNRWSDHSFFYLEKFNQIDS